MRFLFISYAFPGPLGAMASWLGRRAQVIFASSRSGLEAPLPNVQRALLKKYPQKKRPENPNYFDYWTEAIYAGKAAAASFAAIRASGFAPEMIFCASSNGAALNVGEIFPEAFIVNFVEADDGSNAAQRLIRRDIQNLQILKAQISRAFTPAALRSVSPRLRDAIKISPAPIDCQFYAPAQKIKNSLVILCESAAAYCLRLTLAFLKLSPAAQISLACQNSHVWRELRGFRAPRLMIIDAAREETTRDLLAKAEIAVCENEAAAARAQACGCAAVSLGFGGAAYLELPAEDANADATALANLMENFSREEGKKARELALREYCAENVMPEFYAEIKEKYAAWKGN